MTKILFISRAYPPITGGLENQNYELSVWLPKISQTQTIANTRGRKYLPIFAPYALLKAIFLMPRYDVLLLGDGTLAILGWIIKKISNKTVISVVHGLDINYASASLGVWYEKILVWLYRTFWVKIFIPALDKMIAVGNETIFVGISLGIAREKFVFIPNGVDAGKFFEPHTREDLEKIVGEKLDRKKILLTTGRLAIHKGVDWFSENVIPRLDDNVLYLIAGDGIKRKSIETIIRKKHLENKIKMLGKVSDEDLKILYNTAGLYIKPNIKVPGTMEGFGLVAIEAASCALPVIASNLEGLKDAIIDGQNGFLVEPYDTDGFVRKINELLADDVFRKEFGEKARKFVIENYSWEKISKRYLEEINSVIGK